MSVSTILLIVFVVLPLAIIFYVISIYNKLVGLRVQVNEAWSDISVQMKRRYDLIPNLVETVKGYASHEKDTLEQVIAARTAAVSNTGTPEAQAASENMLTGALKQLLALSEAYPDLKANSNFMDLSNELSKIEEVIQRARRFYNGCVRLMNIAVQEFPSNLVAGWFNFTKAEFFEVDETEMEAIKDVPKVSF